MNFIPAVPECNLIAWIPFRKHRNQTKIRPSTAFIHWGEKAPSGKNKFMRYTDCTSPCAGVLKGVEFNHTDLVNQTDVATRQTQKNPVKAGFFLLAYAEKRTIKYPAGSMQNEFPQAFPE